MARKQYEVGHTLHTSWEFPKGVPCVIHDGDSVFCTFPSTTHGEERAKQVCDLLNKDWESYPDM